jgi:DNA repair protein RecN (Recombination protein N)
MLRHLRITNFAILSDVAIDFGPGFNVLTGETGAGKSLVVDAVALLRGGRARSDIPRAGADEAVVEAVFEPPDDLAGETAARLEAAGLPVADEVVVRRVISRGGRSRVHVNGGLTTAAALASLGEVLVDLAGQHEHQGLVDVARHRSILDAFGVDAELVRRVEGLYGSIRKLTHALTEGAAALRTRAEREDFLRFQIEEIDAARLSAGEEAELAAERERLRFAGKLGMAARRAEESLYSGEGAVVDVLGASLRELEAAAAIDARLGGEAQKVGEARVLLEDAAAALRRYAEGISDDPDRLAEVDERIHLVGRLARKHGPTAADILARGEALRAELAALAEAEVRSAEIEAELAAARADAAKAAGQLTDARRKAGRRLEKAAGEALAELGLGGARLEVVVDASPDRLGPDGWDRVELMLCANKGESPRPLARVASGGELSRIMLALKLSLRRADPVATYVFDEVDAGVGGGAAEVVGRQIQRVAESRQVLCVTHLPQIAALADTQFRVEKYEKNGRIETKVTVLGAKDRREEIARMLGGMSITSKTRAHAEEMLSRAR